MFYTCFLDFRELIVFSEKAMVVLINRNIKFIERYFSSTCLEIPVTSIGPREIIISDMRASHQQKIVFCFNGRIRTRIIKRNIQ